MKIVAVIAAILLIIALCGVLVMTLETRTEIAAWKSAMERFQMTMPSADSIGDIWVYWPRNGVRSIRDQAAIAEIYSAVKASDINQWHEVRRDNRLILKPTEKEKGVVIFNRIDWDDKSPLSATVSRLFWTKGKPVR